jgi:hypothetical protein
MTEHEQEAPYNAEEEQDGDEGLGDTDAVPDDEDLAGRLANVDTQAELPDA